jgi:hypothetical protein
MLRQEEERHVLLSLPLSLLALLAQTYKTLTQLHEQHEALLRQEEEAAAAAELPQFESEWLQQVIRSVYSVYSVYLCTAGLFLRERERQRQS